MLELRLKQLLASKGIQKPYTFLKKAGIAHQTAAKLLRGDKLQLNLKLIENLCEHTWCTPNDLFQWTPDTPLKDIAQHPLQAIRIQQVLSIQDDIKKMTPSQLARIQEHIKEEMGASTYRTQTD